MNTVSKLLDSWMLLLDGNLSVNVYRIDVPEQETDNYVVVRPEGGTGENNKRSFNDDVVIITDVVTFFENNANETVADDIDAEIFDLVLTTPQGGALAAQSGMQILNVERTDFTYLQENDVKNIYRKVSRYSHRIHQTA